MYTFSGFGQNLSITAAADTLEKDFTAWARAIYYNDDAPRVNWTVVTKTANYLLEAIAPKAKIKANAGTEDAFFANLQSNIFVFSAAKSFTQYAEISALLVDENGKTRPFSAFKDEVLKLHETYNLRYLKTEYNTALRTAQAAGQWQQFERQKDLFDLQYNTAGDNKVRKDHAKFDRITLPVDHPFWNKRTPPLDWECRCGLRQVAKGSKLTPDNKLKGLPKVPKAFQFNAGKEQLVFSNAHPYIKNLSSQNARELQAVKDYGLKEARAIYAKGKGLATPLKALESKQAARAWFDKKAVDNAMTIKAKIGSKTVTTNLTNKRFSHIIREGTKANRWSWVNRINSIIGNANEVYLLNYEKKGTHKTYRFIKYYQDKILVTAVEVKNGEFNVITAYEAVLSKIEQLREGILIYAKK